MEENKAADKKPIKKIPGKKIIPKTPKFNIMLSTPHSDMVYNHYFNYNYQLDQFNQT